MKEAFVNLEVIETLMSRGWDDVGGKRVFVAHKWPDTSGVSLSGEHETGILLHIIECCVNRINVLREADRIAKIREHNLNENIAEEKEAVLAGWDKEKKKPEFTKVTIKRRKQDEISRCN